MNFINFILERFTNSGTRRDVRLDREPHRVKYKLIEIPFQIASAAIEYAQQFAKSQNWIGSRGVVADQNSSVLLGDARLPEPGRALTFTGSEYIDAGDFPSFGSQMSGGIWFKTNYTTATRIGLFAAYSISPDPDRAIRFFIEPANGQILGYFSDTGATAYQIAGSTSTPAMPTNSMDGKWHHFWFTFDAGQWKFYLDGLEVASQVTTATSIRVPDTPLLIGSDFSQNFKWIGQLADFRLHDTVSTAEEVRAVYLQAKQPWKVVDGQPKFPVIHYPLSEGSNKIAIPAQGLGEDKYASTKPFTADNWIFSNDTGAGFVDNEVQLSGAYISLRPNSTENKTLRGGASYLVTLVIKDWNGGNIQFRPYVGNNTTSIVVAKTFTVPVAEETTVQIIVDMPKVNGTDGYINFQSNGGGTTREVTIVDLKVQETTKALASASANIINGSDNTVYTGSDVPLSLPNLTGATKHCRFNYDSQNRITWTLPNFDVPDKFSWRFVSTVERFYSPGAHVNTLVSLGYISPYWIGFYQEDYFRVIYKDASNVQQAVAGDPDMVWQTGIEYDVTISFDIPASTITLSEANTGQSHVHTMPNGFRQITGGTNNIGGYGSGVAAGANFDGSIDLAEYKVDGVTKMKLDWRQDGLSSAVDPKVATVGFPVLSSASLPEIITTPAKPSDPTKDSYADAPVQHAGLCPKQGQLVNSSCGTFDGNDYVTTTLSIANWTQVSCSAWVRSTNTLASNPAIFGRQSYSQGFELRMVSANERPYFEVKGSLGTAIAETTNALTVGQWHHVAGTYDGTTIRLYMDGQLVSETEQSGVNFGGNDTVIIGARQATTTSLYWYGQIMDARVYDRGLSSAEVADIYAGNGTTTNLQGHWPFTETDGTLIHDVSGNKKNGTALNIATDDFWGTKQEIFHRNVEKGCDVTIDFPSAGGAGKLVLPSAPTGSSSCYAFWFNPRNNSPTNRLLGSSSIAITSLATNLRFTYAAIKDYHFTTFGQIPENEWHHCVISVDDNDATLYVDGVFSETITGTQNPNAGGAMFVGGYGTIGGLFQFGDLVVMDRAVSGQSEVDSLYLGEVPADALFAYSFSGTLEDSTGNNSAATAHGTSTAYQFLETPADNSGNSLFRSKISHPAGVGLNSIVTEIDPTPEPESSYLHSGIGHLSCAGATEAITRPYTGTQPTYIPNLVYDTGFVVSLWFRPFDFLGGGILGGFGNNYIRTTGGGAQIIVRGSHSPNNITFNGWANFNAGDWVHAVLRFDPSQPMADRYSLFVNGTKYSPTTELLSVTAGAYFGIDRVGRYGYTGPNFNGDVKQVRMYSEVFNDDVCEKMHEGKFPKSDNEEVNWPLGSNFGDVSGNSRHLKPQSYDPSSFSSGDFLAPVINSANFGGTTYLGEALFEDRQYVTLDWVWNINNQTNEGFDISFNISSSSTTGSQSIIWAGANQPRIYMFSDGTIRVYIDPTWHTLTGALNDGIRRRLRLVWSQDSGMGSTLQAYIDGVAQTPVSVISPMYAPNTDQVRIGIDSASSNWFSGTLSDMTIKINGGTTYSFPFARDANSTDGTYTGTYANLNTKPIFRTYDSTNLTLGSARQAPSSVVADGAIDSNYTTEGH